MDPPTSVVPDERASVGAEPPAAPWRRRSPWWVALAIVLAVVALAEVAVRVVEPQLPTMRAGDAAEMIVKARQVRAMRAEGGPAVDLVFFGTSMMDAATSPRAVLFTARGGYERAYNASVVGAPLATQARWADEIVLHELDAGLVILGVHPVDLLLTDLLNLNIDAAQSDVIFAKVLRETGQGPWASLDRAANENVALVRRRGSLRQPQVMWEAALRTVGNERKPGEIALRDEDFWLANLSAMGESSQFAGDPFEVSGIADKLRQNLRADAFVPRDLDRLLDVVADHGRPAVVVIPPVPLSAWQQAGVDLGALDAGAALIRSTAERRGVQVVDLSRAAYPDELFADMLHSNDRGAYRFSTDLTAALAELEPARPPSPRRGGS